MAPDKQTLDDLRIDRASARSSNTILKWAAALLLLGLAAAAVLWFFNRPKTPIVQTHLVSLPGAAGGNDRTLLNGSGYVTARREATVSSKVTGKVIEVLVEEGMKVNAGQVLARLDSSNVDRGMALAEAQAESARKAMEETKANLEQAEREHRRSTELAKNNVASQSEVDRTEAEMKSLRARLLRQQADALVAEREVAVWKQQLDDTIIRAPFAGIVTSKNAQPGEMISPMSAGGSFTRTGICTIVDMSSLEIEVEVNETYINRVQPGMRVEAMLDSYPDWRIPAKVIAIIPTANRQNATVKVRVGFEKLDDRMLPDMSVKVAFQATATEGKAAAAPALSIPKAAVAQKDGRDVVWVVRENRAERRAVTLGPARGDEVAISAGLNGGERIVIRGAEKLADGTRVKEQGK